MSIACTLPFRSHIPMFSHASNWNIKTQNKYIQTMAGGGGRGCEGRGATFWIMLSAELLPQVQAEACISL